MRKESEKKRALTQNHLQHGNSDCDQKVHDHLTTFLKKEEGGGGKTPGWRNSRVQQRTSVLVVVTVVGEAM